MKLFAISDLHVRHPSNRRTVEELEGHRDDWLILAGDIGEEVSDLEFVLDTLASRFARTFWVPGNHELWTLPSGAGDPVRGARGEAKYAALVAACRSRGVVTPEDPYVRWPGEGPPTVIVPMHLLYDYTFHPDDVRTENAVAWAMESGVLCVDEQLLHPDPHPSRQDWCRSRVATTRARLDALPEDVQTILVNHFPLRRAHARLPLVPRFSVWCGTRATDDWHLRYRARAVVYGHLHIARTHFDDGVPFEEVSLGYPHQRRPGRPFLRQVLPRPEEGGA